jgi:hypothetical protein
MAIGIERRRLEVEGEAWERAHSLPPRSLAPPPPDLLDRIGAGIKAAIKYAVWAVKNVALATVVVLLVLPYAVTALAVAGSAILVLRVLRR